MISPAKKTVYSELNSKLSHLDLKPGVVVKILDDNFGVIKQDSKMVLFDTCDFWTSPETTAAQSSKTLPSLVSVGDSVMIHAALIQPPHASSIPFLATAVWLASPSPFPAGQCPLAVRRDNIHPDKIKIYEMVSKCTALQEFVSEEMFVTSPKGSRYCKTKV